MSENLTLVERLERLVGACWMDKIDHTTEWNEDYKAIKYALKQVDYMNRPKVSGMKVQGESERLCGTDLKDVEDMPENTVNQSRCPGCGRTVKECQADDVYDDYSDLREPMA